MLKILAFSGSARKDSFNQKLVALAAEGAEKAGGEVTVVNLADYPMPIFDQDFETEHGMPETAKAFKKLLIEHDGFLIASPEYNSAFTPLLKNVLDWASRKEGDEQPLVAYRGKCAAIMSASPGALGGLRGLVFLRMLLANIGVVVLPGQFALTHAGQAFSVNGQLINDQSNTTVMNLGAELVKYSSKLKAD
jgi:chromate reductase